MKTPNYTQAQVAQITNAYESGESIELIAESIGKSVRSVRSKLVERVYMLPSQRPHLKRCLVQPKKSC